jgi:hypothetical protein
MDDLWQIVLVSFFVGVGQSLGTKFSEYLLHRVKKK